MHLHEAGSLAGLRALASDTHRRGPPQDVRNRRSVSSSSVVQGPLIPADHRHQPIYAEVEVGVPRQPPPSQILDRRTNSTVVTAAAWNYRRGECSLIERGDRIKPERSHRRTVQKLTWRESQWVKSFPDSELLDSRVSSMTIADVSPSVAIRRVLLLYEKGQYREAANFITRLNHSTFKAILGDLPLDLFVDSIPHGLPVLEALYAKVFLSDDLNFSVKLLRPDNVIMQMVRMFAQHEEPCTPTGSVRGEIGVVASTLKPVMPSCKKLLKVIVLTEPRTKKQLGGKKRSLDKALEGMGRHGLVGTTDDTLMNLHEALKVEFERAIHQFKTAVQKLDDLSLASKQPVTRSVSYGPAPTDASHQRQLSLRQDEIQERLIKNKTLLNLIEPTLTNHSLEILLQILRKRVEFDKDVLFQFTQLRKEVKDVNPNSIVAPVLMRFSHGCLQVLDLMKEVADDEDDDSSDISGYHSDSDSAIALSGSSQYNGLAARRNHLLYRSARVTSSSSGGSRSGGSSPDARSLEEKSDRSHRLKFKKPNGGVPGNVAPTPRCAKPFVNGGTTNPEPWEVNQLKKDLEIAREELRRTRVVLADLQDRERKMKDRLAEQAQKMLERGVRFENVSMGERRPTALIRKYGNLYAQARVDTLDALDALEELRDGDELKSKLLFSVVVLAFRSVQANVLEIKGGIRRALQIPDTTTSVAELPPSARELEASVNSFLRDTIERFDIRKCVEEVCSQIWATLYDYPCLKGCDGLIQYVRDCVRLAWGLANQHPPFVIEYETRTFRRDMHVRFHASNQDSAEIKTYLWPALLEGHEGPCVHKGVVVT